MILNESKIEQINLALLRGESGRGVWLSGRIAIRPYQELMFAMNPTEHKNPELHHRRSIRSKEYDRTKPYSRDHCITRNRTDVRPLRCIAIGRMAIGAYCPMGRMAIRPYQE
jgi:hypothetical protein